MRAFFSRSAALALVFSVVSSLGGCGGSSDEGSTTDTGVGTADVHELPKDVATDVPIDVAGDVVTDVPADTGVDAAKDATADAPDTDTADAPACPTLKPTRLSKCDTLDQICIYACGSVLRCTAKGWDDDFTVDGGPPCP